MSGEMTLAARAKAEQEAETATLRKSVLDRLRWNPGGRTVEQLAASLKLPGGKVGIGSVLTAMRDDGLVHEDSPGVWVRSVAGAAKPPNPTNETILADLEAAPWSKAAEIATRHPALPAQRVYVALDRLRGTGQVKRRGERGAFEYALQSASDEDVVEDQLGRTDEGLAVDRGPEPPPIPGPDVQEVQADQVEGAAETDSDDDTDEGLGEPCEGCKAPAVTRDAMGVGLCGECYAALDEVDAASEDLGDGTDPEHAPVRPGRWVPAEDGQPGALIGAWHREPGEGGSLTAVCGYRFRLGQRVWEYPPFADGRTICPTCSAPDPVEAFGLSDDDAARVAVRQFSPLQLLRAQRAEAAERLGGAIVSRDYHLAEVDRLKREVGVGRLQLQALDDAIAAFEATP